MAGSGKTAFHSPRDWLAVASAERAFISCADESKQHAGIGLIPDEAGDVVTDQQVEHVELGDRPFEGAIAVRLLPLMRELGVAKTE